MFKKNKTMQDIRGDLKVYKKEDIAMQYFNMALTEYVKNMNMFAVIHLAGAAEEMLGEIVKINNKENALKRHQSSLRRWWKIIGKSTPGNSELNNHILNTKNSIKHINGNDDLEIEVDLYKEAKEIIGRTIENFNQIPSLQQSPELLAYYQHEKK